MTNRDGPMPLALPRLLRSAALALLLPAPGALAEDGFSLANLQRPANAPEVIRPTMPNAVVGLRLDGLRGQGGRITQVGHVFRAGDLPKGTTLAAQGNGGPVRIQTDVMSRHPDGSARHAVLAIENPTGLAALQVALLRVPEGRPDRALTAQGILQRGYSLDLRLDMADGRRVGASADELLLAGLQAGTLRPWRSGPLVTEYRVERQLTPEIRAVFDIRSFANGAVSTSVGVHNDAMFENENEAFAYDATITLGGQVAARHAGIAHHHHSNWREVVWGGGQPSRAVPVFDMAYQMATGIVPNHDLAFPMDRAALDTFGDELAARGRPAPLENLFIEQSMPDTGYRGDLGLLPAWASAYLIGQSRAALDALIVSGEQAGGVPWHFRDPKTNTGATRLDHPNLGFDYRVRKDRHGIAPADYKPTGWRPDVAHQPSLSALPYLVTGDRHLLDQLLFQATWNMLRNPPNTSGNPMGLWINDETRSHAWILREHAYAAQLVPDRHSLKPYLDRTLDQRLDHYIRTHVETGELGAGKGAPLEGYIHGYGLDKPKGKLANFMQDYAAMAFGQVALMGYPKAARMADWMAGFTAGKYLQNEIDPLVGAAYKLRIRDEAGRKLATWGEIYRHSLAAKVLKKPPEGLTNYPDDAAGFLGSTRAALAVLASANAHPDAAEAYAFVAANAREPFASGGRRGYAAVAQWAYAPRFPNGATLGKADERIGGPGADRLEGTGANEVLMGLGGNDTILAGPGSDILAGWDGDDTLATGTGYDKVAGGRGDDTLVLESGTKHATGGPGRDRFHIRARGRSTVVIHDFRPGEDMLVFERARGADPAVFARSFGPDGQGGSALAFRDGLTVTLRGVAPGALGRSIAVR